MAGRFESGSIVDYQAILRSSPDMYLILDPHYTIIDASDAYLKATTVKRENIIGRNIFDVFPNNPNEPTATGVNNLKSSLDQVVATKSKSKMDIQKYDIRNMNSNSEQFEERYWSPVNLPVLDTNNEVTYIIHRVEDVTESDLLKTSLAEKETMMKEIYHRVKNNLQIITSLLNLQATKIVDEDARKIFIENATRVRSISMIHDILYQSESIAQINMKYYVDMLCKYLSDIYSLHPDRITLISDVDEIFLNINTAVPCGLIINELLTNTFKHAFPDNKTGHVNITLKKNAPMITLAVADNGVGLDPDIDIQQCDSLGLKLISNLTNQIKGKLNVDKKNGSAFIITFPDS